MTFSSWSWLPCGLNNAWEMFVCAFALSFVLGVKFVFVVVDLDRRTVIDFRLGSAMRGMCVRAIRVKVNILWLPSRSKNEHNHFLSSWQQFFLKLIGQYACFIAFLFFCAFRHCMRRFPLVIISTEIGTNFNSCTVHRPGRFIGSVHQRVIKCQLEIWPANKSGMHLNQHHRLWANFTNICNIVWCDDAWGKDCIFWSSGRKCKS